MIINKKKILITILAVGLIARIIFIVVYGDYKNNKYWEFGYIAENLHAGNGYSLFYFENDTLKQDFKPNIKPFTSAFMPPAYVYFLYPFFYIENVAIRNLLIYLSQIILSLFLILIIYFFAAKYFSENTALVSAAVVSILPEFIYTTITFNAIIHFQILITLTLYVLLNKDLLNNFKNIIIFSTLSGVILYIRSEYIIFLSFVLLYFLFRKKLKFFITSFAVIFLILSPWIIRNYIEFNEFVPFTTSGGLNFYRGHNQNYIGNWGTPEYSKEIYLKSKGNDFEIIYNRFYFEKAKNFIFNNIKEEIKNSFIKFYNLWVINPDDVRSFNLAYLIPSLLITLFSVIGIIKNFSFVKFKFIYLFLISSTLVAVLFLALPRYQTMMKITLIPFFASTLEYIYYKFKK